MATHQTVSQKAKDKRAKKFKPAPGPVHVSTDCVACKLRPAVTEAFKKVAAENGDAIPPDYSGVFVGRFMGSELLVSQLSSGVEVGAVLMPMGYIGKLIEMIQDTKDKWDAEWAAFEAAQAAAAAPAEEEDELPDFTAAEAPPAPETE